MCGICGTYGFIDKDLLKRMCGVMVHRGPDDEGHYFDKDVMLGMRRLKVIDLDTGNQPIFNEDRSIAVVYNGEIYNYQENREYLEGKGHKFYTQSDTETIVHLYEEFGDDFVNKLRGMFAFALWDSKSERLILARDRIGIKPLYYYFKDGVLIFASELKALLQYPSIKREINFHALHDYLTYLCVPAPDTIFQDIYKLEPGYMIICKNEKIEIKKYWDVCSQHNISGGLFKDEAAITGKMHELMLESIKSHLISDVTLGVFLSGGLDSSSIVAIASEILNKPVKTFSIGFEDDYYNELDSARLVAKRYGTDHHEYIVGPTALKDIENILSFFDEPFADSSAIPTYYVSKYTRQNVTVALSGDGGDEAFGGYGNYKADKIGLLYKKLPAFIRNSIIPFVLESIPDAADNLSSMAKIKKILSLSRMSSEQCHVFWLSCFSGEAKRELYSDSSLTGLLDYDSWDKYTRFFQDCGSSDFINSCMAVDIQTVLPNDYLTKIDRMSMANSLEVRVPFLDHKLLEFAMSISSKYKLKGLTTKYLLKKIMKDKLPEEIIRGRKKGFSIPLSRWFRGDFASLLNEFLSEDIITKRRYFSYDVIKRLSSEHLSGKQDNSKQLWTLICFEVWHRQFMD